MYTDVVNNILELIRKMYSMDKSLDAKMIEKSMNDVCHMLNVGLVEVCIYQTMRAETLDKGDKHFICRDGECDDEVFIRRYVLDNASVIIYKFYHRADAEPWSDFYRSSIKLVSDIVFVFNSRERLRQLADRFAMCDPYGYRNLSFFAIFIDKAVMSGKLENMAVAFFNLKHFQAVNNQFGRKIGDVVIKEFSNGLSQIVGDSGVVCRVGGDNFITAYHSDLMDEVLSYLSGTAVIYDRELGERVNVSASAGVLVIDKDFVYNDLSDIMDKVMPTANVAKRGELGDVVFYNKEIIEGRDKVVYVQQQFTSAIEQEEFLVYYQPKFNVFTGEMVGAEALCRWLHKGCIVPPSDFIPVLEQDMAICKLDFYMLDHLCKDIRRWLNEGRKVVRISFNLSRKHMMDIDLLEHLMEIIDRNNVPHEYIEVELTETTTDVEFRDLKRVVGGLRDTGVCTSVDDFGIGYSSLNLIKELPWKVLKIDKSILPVNSEDERSVMFKYVVAMAKEMGLECIAEGVETDEQVDILKKNGCDFAQGFRFARPMPMDEFEKTLTYYNE